MDGYVTVGTDFGIPMKERFLNIRLKLNFFFPITISILSKYHGHLTTA